MGLIRIQGEETEDYYIVKKGIDNAGGKITVESRTERAFLITPRERTIASGGGLR